MEFNSKRLPIWGDFYLKDGTQEKEDVYAYNLGFNDPDTDPDPIGPIWLNMNGDLTDVHIAVPDTDDTGEPPIVPEPATWLLLISTAAVGAITRRRRSD